MMTQMKKKTYPILFQISKCILYPMNQLNRWLFSAAIILALDFIYMNLNQSAFESQIVRIQRVVMKVKPVPALMCYALLVFALNYFILRTHRPILDAFMLGLIINGVLESTNYAIFKKWDWKIATMDGLWGGVLFALTTAIIYSF